MSNSVDTPIAPAAAMTAEDGTTPSQKKGIPGWAVVLLLPALAVGGIAASYPVREWLTVRELLAELSAAKSDSDLDRARRAKCCYRLGAHESREAADALAKLLATEESLDVCEAAAYSIQKLGDSRASELIAGVLERLPDSAAKAKIITYYARTAGRAALEQIRPWATSGEIWREIGAGAALLELDEVVGADVLLRYAAGDNEHVRAMASELLRRFSEPIMEMVGQPMDPAAQGNRPEYSDDELAQLRAWWKAEDRSRELADFNSWSRRANPTRHEIDRLLHARERATRFIGLDE